jgi:dolichyl-phosphate-mannose-protein mannosyltransferase
MHPLPWANRVPVYLSSQARGRCSLTGYPHNDTNNLWQIIPSKQIPVEAGHHVKAGDLVQLRHVVTDTWLLSHDVASPYFPTNQEFSTVTTEEAKGERFNDTLFEIRVDGAKSDAVFKTMSSQFRLIHNPSKVAMWTHTKPLPEWAFKQAEINGNKNVLQPSNIWYVEDIAGIPADSPRLIRDVKKVKTMPFFSKYLELQRAMFFHNNALTSSHPYSSFPIQWPFLFRGVSFWTENDTRQQIYFLGNPVGWWIASSVLAVFAGIILADQMSLRRGVDAMDKRKLL